MDFDLLAEAKKYTQSAIEQLRTELMLSIVQMLRDYSTRDDLRDKIDSVKRDIDDIKQDMSTFGSNLDKLEQTVVTEIRNLDKATAERQSSNSKRIIAFLGASLATIVGVAVFLFELYVQHIH